MITLSPEQEADGTKLGEKCIETGRYLGLATRLEGIGHTVRRGKELASTEWGELAEELAEYLAAMMAIQTILLRKEE